MPEIRPIATLVLSCALAVVCACGGPDPKTPASGQKGDEPAPRWEPGGETPPTEDGAKPAASAAPPAPPPAAKGDVDLDTPTKGPSGTTEVHASIAAKEILFRRARMVGNTREGFTLTVFESTTPKPPKAEISLKLTGTPTSGKPSAVALTFLQIVDDGPNSVGGVRSVECSGKGKLAFDTVPPLPKNPPNEEVELGEASGIVTLSVKCSGADTKLGSFAIAGKVSARVLVIPSGS